MPLVTTTHTFTKLGFRTMPIAGAKLVRDNDGKKQLLNIDKQPMSFNDAMPSNWTQVYGKSRTKHKDTLLGGLICGELQDLQDNEIEVIALDCDNQAAWDLFTALDPDYLFRFKSVGKPGGTVIYSMPEELRDMAQYSVKTDTMHFEYMARRASGANAMVYLPTAANETKENISRGAELEEPPQQVIELIKLMKPQPVLAPPVSTATASINLPFNAPLAKQFVLDCKDAAESPLPYGRLEVTPLVERVFSIFTPKKFRNATHYQEHKWLHPNSQEIMQHGAWSEYIVGVSAIVGADPSIDAELYTDFMQAINAQIDDPMKPERFLTEVISPMVSQKAQAHGKPIWKYNEKWDQTSHTIVNQYGETLEYYTLETAANRFVEYNHTSKELLEIQGVRSLRDQIYSKDTDPEQEVPAASIVKKLKLVRVEESIKMPLGIFTDNAGHTILNTAEPTLALRILRNPELLSEKVTEDNHYVQAFNVFLAHIVNSDPLAIKFMKQVIAYHGKHLNNIPVILYMVGTGGAGKSHFAHFLELIFGTNATSRPSAAQITSKFNDFLENTALLVLSETNDSAVREQEGIKAVLKTVTGEKTIDIESKGKAVRTGVPVFALPILLANEPWYEEDAADRRLFSIMPKFSMTESKLVSAFEKQHGVRIVDFIEAGIKSGIISKYLSTFCPKRLPAVPVTEDKQLLSLEQKDPIMVVKNLVASKNYYKLFDLMEEYNVDIFFTCMDSPKTRDKNALYKNQLVELVKGLRGENTFMISDSAISRAFTPRWLPAISMQYRPAAGNNFAKKLGYVKWAVDIAEPYEAWKLSKLEGDEI